MRKHSKLVLLQLAILCLLAVALLGGKPKAKLKDTAPSELPKDLNKASLRIRAADMIYELDLTTAQMKMLQTAADGAADDRDRSPAKGNAKLVTTFGDFYLALLSRADDQDIAKLRNQMTDLATDDAVHLDDDIHATDTARARAPQICRQFTVGQIAAYLAAHADQIADPAERMVSELTELNDSNAASDADAQIQRLSEELGRLVAGQDKQAATAVTVRISTWLKTNHSLSEEQLVNGHASLEASAKKVIGDVPPMDILGHWMDNEVADLLSNPQFSGAVNDILEHQDKAN